MELWLLLSLPVLLLTGWFYTVTVVRTRFPTLRNKAIVLLIAHPDDEAMFFAPTVLSLTEPSLGNHLKILCLSNGDADGLGSTRAQEIKRSAVLLGLRSEADVHVIDDVSLFRDSMTTTWSSSSIADLLTSLFTKPGSKTRKQAGEHARGEAPQETTISVLITFDRGGVSGHPNHISLYHGAIEWVRGIMKGKGGWDSPVAVYTLGSVSIVRKYIGGLDALLTMVRTVAGTWGKAASDKPESLMFLNDALSYRQAQKAMTQAHKSQMRWFRWGWITIGRYMVVNDLKRERIV